MATAVQVESIWNGLTDNSGQPLAAGKVYTYAAGTTTPVALYTASDKSSSATNPLILDGNGKAQVWADGRYKFVVKTSSDVTLYTLDNLLYGFDDTTVLLGGTSTGSANAQVVSVPATVESYANGQRITFVAGYTNTGATTLQFNSLSAVSIVKGPTAANLQAGDIIAGQLYSCTYYGGSFRLENVPTPADVQRSRSQLVTGVAGTNTITGNVTPALTGYETGEVFRFKAANSNTAAATINIDGLGAKTIQRFGVALVAGEIQSNDMVEVVYDGTQFQLVNATPAPLFIDRTNSRIGIGTTAPTVALDLQGIADIESQITEFSNTSSGPYIALQKSRGATVGTNTIVQNGDEFGNIIFRGANGSSYTAAAAIGVVCNGTPGASNDMPGMMVLSTTGDGSGTPTGRVYIDSSGRVGIGAASSAAMVNVEAQGSAGSTREFVRISQTAAADNITSRIAFNNYNGIASAIDSIQNAGANFQSQLVFSTQTGSGMTEKMRINAGGQLTMGTTTNLGGLINLQLGGTGAVNDIGLCTKNFVDGNYACRFANTAGTEVGKIVVNVASTSYTTTSDYRLKKDVTPMVGGLSKVLQLKPCTWKWDNSAGGSQGFIAHELQSIIPEAVTGEKDEVDLNNEPKYQGVDASFVVATLTSAIQELNAKVEALEARVAALEA